MESPEDKIKTIESDLRNSITSVNEIAQFGLSDLNGETYSIRYEDDCPIIIELDENFGDLGTYDVVALGNGTKDFPFWPAGVTINIMAEYAQIHANKTGSECYFIFGNMVSDQPKVSMRKP